MLRCTSVLFFLADIICCPISLFLQDIQISIDNYFSLVMSRYCFRGSSRFIFIVCSFLFTFRVVFFCLSCSSFVVHSIPYVFSIRYFSFVLFSSFVSLPIVLFPSFVFHWSCFLVRFFV